MNHFARVRILIVALAGSALACGGGGDGGGGSTTFTCAAAAASPSSVGCDFYAVNLEMLAPDTCLAVLVANAGSTPAHLDVEYDPATPLAIEDFTRIPSGTGPTLALAAYDPVAGLAPGGYAVLFLAGTDTAATGPCPAGVTAAVPTGSAVAGTGVGRAFHLVSDSPIAAYQMNPWSAGGVMNGSSLLLPTSSWGTDYVALTAGPATAGGNPSLDVVALDDLTTVTLLPPGAVAGGGGLPSSPANTPVSFILNRGQHAQLSQPVDLTGSVVVSDKPVGLFAAGACVEIPLGIPYCDHAEQMLPPIPAIGHDYAAVQYRPREPGDLAVWRLAGVVDGTLLTYSPAVAGAPASLGAGQEATFTADGPFAVRSQDAAHPFLLLASMTGAEDLTITGYGDPEVVLATPAAQFGTDVLFVTDPTFPETNLVVVRARDATGLFREVILDCAGVLAGWQAVGEYEWTRLDLVRHDFVDQGSCSNGWQHAASMGPFAITVWGWGTPETTTSTLTASYGYQAGAGLRAVNGVVVTADPR